MLYIFDIEGVLLDAKEAVRYAAEKVRKRNKIESPISENDLLAVLSGTMGMTDILVHENADGKSRRDALMLFGRHLDDVFPRFSTVYPQVPQILGKLKSDGHTLVAFSNRITLFMYQWLYDTNLVSYFDLVIGVDSVPEELPSAAAIQHILQQTHHTSKDILLISDSFSEIESARLAQIPYKQVSYGTGIAFLIDN